MTIDARGRCCGKKPLHYKRGLHTSAGRPQLWCDRCYRAYDPETREQIDNWWFAKDASGQFVKRSERSSLNSGRQG